ncbi:redox-regulated ATPase YchF [Anaerofustis butyriciformans]|mgnify:CR=1 FL=1|uniref:redox-regulated ATPase YchF n=1 Tax=Anaerofustis TaxID=264995 RepID=UPI002E321178|nr:redox-regulated ATPase YchF [Anaerofustis sp. HA2171]
MKIGLVGLPNVGKSTLFNALTKANAGAENYPFCTIEPNVGVVNVPDERIDNLSKLYDTLKTVYATVEFVDIAGLVKNAGKGEGLGNQFLSNIRNVHAILQVVRCFDDGNITHVDGSIDPVRDAETINYELIFSDLELIDKRIATVQKAAKSGRKEEKFMLATLDKAKKLLEEGKFINLDDFDENESEYLKSQDLLTTKPIMYAANVSEDDLLEDNDYVKALKEYVKEVNPNIEVIKVCAKIEAELSELEDDEKNMFLEELGIKESGLDQIIKEGYKLLDLITFLTAGKQEVKGWQIKKGTKAPGAAGKIHSDFERGFIRAEVTKYDKLMEAGSDVKAKELAYTRIEGKDYVVEDGDVIFFRFNV